MVRQDVQSVFLRSKGIKCIKVRFFLLTSILHCGLEISLRAIAHGFESHPLRQNALELNNSRALLFAFIDEFCYNKISLEGFYEMYLLQQ